jgi:hypothetical protein
VAGRALARLASVFFAIAKATKHDHVCAHGRAFFPFIADFSGVRAASVVDMVTTQPTSRSIIESSVPESWS